jgi:UDP-N-acetyl-2-amino-2-deoxyglucuronate dehydrogenase
MKAAIDAGKIGTPVLGTVDILGWRDEAYYASNPWRGTWAGEGGGVLVNQAPHQLDLLQWFMGPIEELSGYWDNLNHPSIPVDDTAVAVIRFRSGGLGVVVASNSQRPGIGGQLHVHGSNGASVGTRTDAGSMFISGVTETVEPAVNDLWTVDGEADLLSGWQAEDRAFATAHDPMSWFHERQIEDFLAAIVEDRPPAVDGAEGRKVVELFTAIYRSQRDHRPVAFPLVAEADRDDLDGRLASRSTTGGAAR